MAHRVPASHGKSMSRAGYVFGDIYDNFESSALDNTNAIPEAIADDVSMAIAYDILLGLDQVAVIDFYLSNTPINSTFQLIHSDNESRVPGPNESSNPASIYFAANLAVQGDSPAPIPEPATIVLMGIGIISFIGGKKFRILKRLFNT